MDKIEAQLNHNTVVHGDSFALEILRDQKQQNERLTYVLFLIISMLIAFIFWQDYNHKQVLTQYDEKVWETTQEVTQEADNGGNNNFVGGNVNDYANSQDNDKSDLKEK